ncbi:unnamed protein product [Gongylonema pulchrum]|uniref:Propeptide_C25 domain-containing protein n=1 Tax=Gongylonema pulchrum TaxID=637853 RepID=A0A183CYJ3_9BILA|nr:unnamed protein product [Gongylonema pulchrum]
MYIFKPMNHLIWYLTLLCFCTAGANESFEFILSTELPLADNRPEISISNEPAVIPTNPGIPVALQTETPEPQPVKIRRSDLVHTGTPAGIYFRISQKGVDYITGLAAEALPQLLENSQMPTVEQPQIKISQLTIDKFSNPAIQARFIANAGVEAQVHLPQVMLNAIYDASTFFATYKGKFKAEVKNLSVIMEVHISRNETEKINIIEANYHTPVCNVTSSLVRIVFAGDMSTYLNLMR